MSDSRFPFPAPLGGGGGWEFRPGLGQVGQVRETPAHSVARSGLGGKTWDWLKSK